MNTMMKRFAVLLIVLCLMTGGALADPATTWETFCTEEGLDASSEFATSRDDLVMDAYGVELAIEGT